MTAVVDRALGAAGAQAGGTPVHPWRLLAPWYRWPAQGVPDGRTARETRPALQKYDAPSFVEQFLADPQRSLQFVDEDRWHYLAQLGPSSPFGTRSRRLSDQQWVSTPTKKVFLPTHSRFYLVVCSLHCDQPGLPIVDRADVCQAGLVVRRRRATRPAGGELPADVLQRLAQARTELADVELGALADAAVEAEMAAGPAWSKRYATRLSAAQKLHDAQADLASWIASSGIELVLEGWNADATHPQVGSWQPVEETPAAIDESWFPLQPLVVPPDAPADHAGRDATLYFGVVPAGGHDLTTAGEPRFDDASLYEVRCFVRRHDQRCPRGDAPDCRGEVVWSEATDRYMLAAALDLDGTAHRPITVKLPDVKELVARAATAPRGLRTITPADSLMINNDGKNVGSGSRSKAEICTFAIPLITIVAMFVFSLFLGILMFVFNLWVLLALRICLPPSLSIEGAFKDEINALPPTVDIDVSVSLGKRTAYDNALYASFAAEFGVATANGLNAAYSPNALLQLHRHLTGKERPAGSGGFLDGVVYEPPVARAEVKLR